MLRIDDILIVRAILSAPGWARVGISDPTPWMREDAAAELAQAIRMQVEALAETSGLGPDLIPKANQSELSQEVLPFPRFYRRANLSLDDRIGIKG